MPPAVKHSTRPLNSFASSIGSGLRQLACRLLRLLRLSLINWLTQPLIGRLLHLVHLLIELFHRFINRFAGDIHHGLFGLFSQLLRRLLSRLSTDQADQYQPQHTHLHRLTHNVLQKQP